MLLQFGAARAAVGSSAAAAASTLVRLIAAPLRHQGGGVAA
jgi:hypothetical protein